MPSGSILNLLEKLLLTTFMCNPSFSLYSLKEAYSSSYLFYSGWSWSYPSPISVHTPQLIPQQAVDFIFKTCPESSHFLPPPQLWPWSKPVLSHLNASTISYLISFLHPVSSSVYSQEKSYFLSLLSISPNGIKASWWKGYSSCLVHCGIFRI